MSPINSPNQHWARWSGTASGGAAPYLNAKSIAFDGVNERFNIPYSAALDWDGATAWSISFWIKPNTGNNYRNVYDRRLNDATLRGVSVQQNTGNVRFFTMSNAATSDWMGWSSNTTLNNAVWNHVAVTNDGSKAFAGTHIWVNGTDSALSNVLGTTTITGTLANGSQDNKIGGATVAGGFFFEGNLDQMLIYPGLVLDATAVAALRNGGGPAADPTLLSSYASAEAYWEFGDGADTNLVLNDLKNSHHGSGENVDSGDLVADVP